LFPSYSSIDRARFPAADVLVEELRDAPFESVRVVAFKQPVRHSRDRALTLLRERFTSTFALLPEDEYRAALRVRSASCRPLASAASTSWSS
jgi:hypothetical protein